MLPFNFRVLKTSDLGLESRTTCCYPWVLRPSLLCGCQSRAWAAPQHVPSCKVDDGAEEVQGHRGNLMHVMDSIASGKSAGHHVRISSDFHLKIKQQSGIALRPPHFEEPHPLTSTPSMSQHFQEFLLLSCFFQKAFLPQALMHTFTASSSELWEQWGLYFLYSSSKPVKQAAMHKWGKSWRIACIHQEDFILPNLKVHTRASPHTRALRYLYT